MYLVGNNLLAFFLHIEKLTESVDKTKALEDLITNLKQELMWFESERRIWHNVIQDLKGLFPKEFQKFTRLNRALYYRQYKGVL